LEITILNRQRAHAVTATELERFVERLVEQLPAPEGDSLALCLVSDRRMRELNRRFRGRDATTDVLSFPAGPPPGDAAAGPLGDIVVSIPTALRQAADAGHSLDRELKTLVLHGYLHLLGFDHETDDGSMMRLQAKLARELVHDGAG
jgi:probable rRNA maturation factor